MDKKWNFLKNLNCSQKTSCSVCGEYIDSNKIISFPKMPLTEILVDFKNDTPIAFLDQEFYYCENCQHGQLNNVIDPVQLYNHTYFTRTNSSNTGSYAIDVFFDFIKKNIGSRKIESVVDIGCNDLYALKKFENISNKLVGIDPVLKNISNPPSNISIYPNFFENINLEDELDVVISSHTLEHVSNPLKFLKKLISSGTDKTTFFFQFPCLDCLVKDWHYEQIFHQHLNYFSFNSIKKILESLDCQILDFDFNNNHWGTLMVSFRKKSFNINNQNISNKNYDSNLSWLLVKNNYDYFKKSCEITNERLKNDEFIAFGAALMMPLFAYHISGLNNIKYIIDDDSEKDGLYYINFPKQIVTNYGDIDFTNTNVVLTALTAKNALRKISQKLIDMNTKNIIIPFNLL